ncbi:cutinase family protein [Gordonia sp. zg691]|uniref:cutinase family protein n=1 Tax=Gordonia jinghuaiqii TaxID=2758710 RepID=UPI00166253C4|nr:cutinase family protein [Gordonia jinghuaiqii]MBD0860625.1 cutinase family protein [Gordonia jinghuaiqii]
MKRLISAVIGSLLVILGFQVALEFKVVQGPVAEAAVCPASQNFVVGGTGDRNGVNTPNVPAGPRTNIVYPASISPVGGHESGDESVRIGTDGLTRALNGFRARCPGSAVTIIGYSLGAVVVSNVCDRLSGWRKTCITEGNPKRQPGADGAGIMGVLPTFIPGFTFTGWREAPAGGPRIVELCNLRDLYCSSVNPLKDPLTFVERAVGTYCQQQHSYPAPCADPVLPYVPVPWDVPNLRDLDPLTRQLVPAAPIRIDAPYIPTRLGDFLPPIVRDALPAVVTDWVPPPVPPLAADSVPLPGSATTPTVAEVATPTVAEVATPTVAEVATPTVAEVATPTVAEVATPTVAEVATPTVAEVAVPPAISDDSPSPDAPDTEPATVSDLVPAEVADVLPPAVADFVPPAPGDLLPDLLPGVPGSP